MRWKRWGESPSPLWVRVFLGVALVALAWLVAQPRVLIAQQPGFPAEPKLALQASPSPAPKPPPTAAPPATALPKPPPTAVPPATALPQPPPTAAPATPPPTGQPSDDTAATSAAVAELGLRDGTIAFNPNLRMTEQKPEDITVNIFPQAINSDLVAKLQEKGAVNVQQIRIGSKMALRLTGTNFEMISTPPEVQPISNTESNQWTWTVKPLRSGTQKLNLSVSVVIDDTKNGTQIHKEISVLARDITVEVDPAYNLSKFIGDNWQWLAASIIIPIVTYFLGRRSQG
jgi:hypothetical protein